MFRFNSSTIKEIQAAALLAQLEGGRIDRLRLLKLLYIADRESLAERGAPIIGGRIVALDNGPLHSSVYDLIKGAHEDFRDWSHYFYNDGHVVVLKQDPDRLELSQYEIEKLTAVSDANRSIDTWEVAEKTHEFPEWKQYHLAGTSRTIPLEGLLAEVGFSNEDITQIQRDATSHNRLEALLGRSSE